MFPSLAFVLTAFAGKRRQPKLSEFGRSLRYFFGISGADHTQLAGGEAPDDVEAAYDKALYKERNRVENFFKRIKHCAGLAERLFTRSGDIGSSRSLRPVSCATALPIAGATSGVDIVPRQLDDCRSGPAQYA